MSQKFQIMLQIAESNFEKLPRVCRTPAYAKRYLELHDTLYAAMTLARTKVERGRVYRISQTIWSELLAAGANPSEVRELLADKFEHEDFDFYCTSKDKLRIGVTLLKYGATNINRENLIELFKQCDLSKNERIEYAKILNQKEA